MPFRENADLKWERFGIAKMPSGQIRLGVLWSIVFVPTLFLIAGFSIPYTYIQRFRTRHPEICGAPKPKQFMPPQVEEDSDNKPYL